MLRKLLKTASFLRKREHVAYFSSKSLPSTMHAWCLHGYGKNNLPVLESIALPKSLKPNEVLVQVKAASLNPIDAMMPAGFGSVLLANLRKWNKSDQKEFPVILGRDFSGTVVKRGSQVTRVKEGDEVWGTPAIWRRGSFAEYCCVGQDELAIKPKKLNHVEATSFPYVHLTMWAALCGCAGLNEQNTKGKRLFIVGGSGGVGNVSIQIMKHWGAHVTTSCSTDAVELVKNLGADVVIDYKTEDIEKRIQNEARYDVILDSVGGNLEYFTKRESSSCSKSTYVLLMPPMLDYFDQSGLALGSLRTAQTFLGTALRLRLKSNIDYKWGFFEPNSSALNYLESLVTSDKIVPVIDSVFAFSDLKKAIDKLNHGHLRGKIVVDFQT